MLMHHIFLSRRQLPGEHSKVAWYVEDIASPFRMGISLPEKDKYIHKG